MLPTLCLFFCVLFVGVNGCKCNIHIFLKAKYAHFQSPTALAIARATRGVRIVLIGSSQTLHIHHQIQVWHSPATCALHPQAMAVYFVGKAVVKRARISVCCLMHNCKNVIENISWRLRTSTQRQQLCEYCS
jgi:hypothetical protein